jgi:hypothetical protein
MNDFPYMKRKNQNSQGTGRSASPSKSGQTKGSLVWSVTKLIETVFSHKGMFWLGVAIALVSFIANLQFYFWLLELFGVSGWGLPLGAFGISFGTCLFEVMPTIWGRSRTVQLNQIFSAASKPDELPSLNPSITNADELIQSYRDSDRKTSSFFKMMRWVAIAAESLLGVLFIGNVGVGGRALIKLLQFIGSVFGVEWGVALAVKAGQFELPPEVRDQLNALIAGQNKKLNLKKIGD